MYSHNHILIRCRTTNQLWLSEWPASLILYFSISGSLFLNDASNAHTQCETTWIHAKSTWNCNLAWIISSICSLLRLPFSLVIVSILDFPVDFSIADTRLGSPMDPSPDSACRRAKVTNLSMRQQSRVDHRCTAGSITAKGPKAHNISLSDTTIPLDAA